MKNRKFFFSLTKPLYQILNLLAFLFITAFLIACNSDDSKTIRERLVENDWENKEVISVWGNLLPDAYTGVYNFNADGTYTQSFNDSILSGKWEMQGDSIVVFNKVDITKRRFWKDIELSEDYLQVIFSTEISISPYLDAYDLNGSYVYQKEIYKPVK